MAFYHGMLMIHALYAYLFNSVGLFIFGAAISDLVSNHILMEN